MTKEEFENNVLPLKNKLFCFALSILKNKEESRDVVQDVMLKIWSSGKKLKDYNNLEAWCMTLIRNRSLDKLKVKSNRFEQVDGKYDISSETPDPMKKLVQKDLLDRIGKIIETLPANQQEAIQLRDFQGYSYKEIAEILEIDMNLVKVNIHRARTTIKKQIIKLNSYGLQSL